MKKNALVCTLIFVMLLGVVGCSSEVSYLFTVTTGDKVKVTLDTTDKWRMEQKDGKFTVKEGNETIVEGIFSTADYYKQMEDAVRSDETVTILDESTKDGHSYIFYTLEGAAGTENDIILKIKDAKTSIILASTVKQSKVEEAFKRLTFTNENE